MPGKFDGKSIDAVETPPGLWLHKRTGQKISLVLSNFYGWNKRKLTENWTLEKRREARVLSSSFSSAAPSDSAVSRVWSVWTSNAASLNTSGGDVCVSADCSPVSGAYFLLTVPVNEVLGREGKLAFRWCGRAWEWATVRRPETMLRLDAAFSFDTTGNNGVVKGSVWGAVPKMEWGTDGGCLR